MSVQTATILFNGLWNVLEYGSAAKAKTNEHYELADDESTRTNILALDIFRYFAVEIPAMIAGTYFAWSYYPSIVFLYSVMHLIYRAIYEICRLIENSKQDYTFFNF